MSTHSKFSPSQLPRIIRCPGSVKATQDMESESSSFAQEGTMLHGVMEDCLNASQFEVPQAQIDKNKLTDEHIDACNDCLDFVFTILAKHETDPYIGVETKVGLGGYSEDLDCPEMEDVYGTLDLIIRFPLEKTMYIIDWKFGKGIEVFPDSEQLKAYALAALKNERLFSNFESVVIVVAQPRLYTGERFKTEAVCPQELYDWAKAELAPALTESQQLNPKRCASDKACQWCLVKNQCPERHGKALRTAKNVFAAHANLPNKITIEDLCKLLGDARELTKYISDIEKFIMSRLKAGHEAPGYKLVAGRSIRKWAQLEDGKPTEFLEWIEDEHGFSEFDLSIIKPMSPAQVEKKVKRAIAKTEEFRAFINKPEGKPTMVPESDKREALVYGAATDAFASFKES